MSSGANIGWPIAFLSGCHQSELTYHQHFPTHVNYAAVHNARIIIEDAKACNLLNQPVKVFLRILMANTKENHQARADGRLNLSVNGDGSGRYSLNYDAHMCKNTESFSHFTNSTSAGSPLSRSQWVAYPLNQKLVGRGSRSGAWQYDKFMSAKKQPNLRRTYQAGSVEGYIRGHLCPSSDRMRPGMNEQTFYFTNMAPQDPYLNGRLWAWLEEHVQQLALEAGEAWVVTGCIDTDSSNWVTDITGKPMAVPEAFFKAVLLRSRDDTGGGEHYEARAWVVENRSYGFSGFEQKAMALEVSIDQLESIIGRDLYPNLLRLIGTAAAAAVEAGE